MLRREEVEAFLKARKVLEEHQVREKVAARSQDQTDMNPMDPDWEDDD